MRSSRSKAITPTSIPVERVAFAFPNPIDDRKVERYRAMLRSGKVAPAVRAYKRTVDEIDVERGDVEFIGGRLADETDIGQPVYYLRDGYHRATAAMLEGRKTIAAVPSDPGEVERGLAATPPLGGDCVRPRYWGRGGAGMMFICSADRTVLLLLRASWVAQGGTWGVAGGGVGGGWYSTPIEPIVGDEPFLDTALREVREECGGMPPRFKQSQIVDKTEYVDCGFRYVTFIADLTAAQKRAWKLRSDDGETDEFQWVKLSQLEVGGQIDGRDLHFGVEFTLTHAKVFTQK